MVVEGGGGNVVVGAEVDVVGEGACALRCCEESLLAPLLPLPDPQAAPTRDDTVTRDAKAARPKRCEEAAELTSTDVTRPRRLAFVVGLLGLVSSTVLTSCSSRPAAGRARDSAGAGAGSTSTSTIAAAAPTTSNIPPTTSTTSSSPPAFVGTVSAVAAADVPSTYRAGCPVDPSELRMLHMSYWGFDGQPHVGTMVVNAAVTSAVLSVFGQLYAEQFPIREMEPEDAFGGSDPDSMAADNTSGFNCRYAVAPGAPQWSVHAYGEAIDVDPVENPYLENGQWLPAAGAAYADRSDVRPGMAVAGGELVNAFASVGWYWGGRWTDGPDYQHFSATGG